MCRDFNIFKQGRVENVALIKNWILFLRRFLEFLGAHYTSLVTLVIYLIIFELQCRA